MVTEKKTNSSEDCNKPFDKMTISEIYQLGRAFTASVKVEIQETDDGWSGLIGYSHDGYELLTHKEKENAEAEALGYLEGLHQAIEKEIEKLESELSKKIDWREFFQQLIKRR